MMENTELPVQGNTAMNILDDMDMDVVTGTLNKISKFQDIVNKTLKKDQDYGVITGTSKPTLLKPGAEKILMLLGLTSEYDIIEKVEDYEKGIFAYTIKCTLLKNGLKITEGVGSCNSKEDKYRWRWVKEPDLPSDTYTADLKTKDNGHGKTLYRVENDEIYSQANTILKMAKKRAQIDATLTVGALSQIFTQDIEDMSQFNQQESMETMTTDDAMNMKLTFGKHKGQTLKQVDDEFPDYLEWLSENAKDEVLKKACKMVMDYELNKDAVNNQSTQDKGNTAPDKAQDVCADCGKPSSIGKYTAQKFGRVLCHECMQKELEKDADEQFKGTPME